MSYEGREWWLCANGHLHGFDCYMTPSEGGWSCPDCGLPRAWWCSIDDTNCEPVYPRLRVDQPEKTERCAHCGVTRVVAKKTFKIPVRKP